MFFQGALQEGISSAVSQQKPVLCFVTNGNDESEKWENEFLQDDAVSMNLIPPYKHVTDPCQLNELIKNAAVALRLTAGSEEAGYLAQIFPLPQTPTIVIMKNGELKEYIVPGISKDDFVRRIQKAFSTPAAQQQPTAQATAPPAQPANPTVASDPGTSESVRRVLAERAERLAATREQASRTAQEERAKAKEKAKAEAEAGANTDAARVHNQAELVKKKRQEEAEERRRILKRIEDDRAERRQRASQREKARTESQSAGGVASALVNAPETKLPSTTRIGNITAIQVRLFDGSTARSRFPTTSSLKEVRKWVDESRVDGTQPYTFKHLLTPLPSRSIDATEEDKTLADLNLAPSSTLILIPVQGYTSAYESGSSNPVSKLFALILGLFTWLFGFFGLGTNRRQQAASSDSTSTSTSEQSQDRSRVRGFQSPADQRRDHQLYNGNSLNFEPRPDEDEKQ
ncbi:hypothetical protein S7711_08751 [Stachybotrys chartarum IBT 7711]|uniref:UBX domain-containing protein n=1 Tax=Stachybotrys chartarum (strain CBS 109288 / IBT 7711) TaxID=1280523 RepID=A0A084AJN7_STACB|nr:hypothetical protein S7711_08751 [Stachybotrys chartarum IBT 7711]